MTPAQGSGTIRIAERGFRIDLFRTAIGGWYWFGFVLIRLAWGDLGEKHRPPLVIAADVAIFAMLFWTLYRPWHMGILIGERGVTIRNYFRTRRARWSEVAAFTDGTTDRGKWALNVMLRDGRGVAVTATQAQRGSPEVLTAVRHVASLHGVPAKVSGIPAERPRPWLDATSETRRLRTWIAACSGIAVSAVAATVLLAQWGSAHRAYSPANLAGFVALIVLLRGMALGMRLRKRQAPVSDRYGEGGWFAVPLPKDTGFAPGLVTRTEPRKNGIQLCYFFPPTGSFLPTLDQLRELRPADVLLVQKLDKLDKDWPRLGNAPGWDPSAWPVPAFRVSAKKKDQLLKAIYDDDLRFVDEAISDRTELDGLPSNEVLSSSAIAGALAQLLKARSPV
ncbi:MAG TPA: PH domain-containing protein [Streptosporangiaceae bacterium]|jgi:hypothetical protein